MIRGYHAGNDVMVDDTGWICHEKPISSLLARWTEEPTMHVACNLDYLVAWILHKIEMAEPELRKLYDNTEIVMPPYRLRYVPGKFFSIGMMGYGDPRFIVISDANRYNYWSFSPGEDPVEGAKHAKKTGEWMLQGLEELGLTPKTLISPVRAWEKERWNEMDVPTASDIPELAAQYSYACCDGNWLELYSKGHFSTVYDFDLRSAYCSVAANLMDPRMGQWIRNPKYQPLATYGYALCDINIKSFALSPITFVHITKEGRDNYTPSGKWERVLPKCKLDYITQWKLGEFTIKDAVWWQPDEEVFPLREHIMELYQEKEAGSEVAKYVLNGGFYGKFIQIKHNRELGDHFMSMYAAEIENQVQVKVADTCMLNKIMPISIEVDGFKTDKKLPIFGGKKIGDWRLSSTCAALAVSSGVVALEDHIPDKDFSLDYKWLMEQIRGDPGAREYKKQKWNPVSLGKACQENRLQDLGKLELITKTIDVAHEKKRSYPNPPRTGGDLLTQVYNSIPKDASMLL